MTADIKTKHLELEHMGHGVNSSYRALTGKGPATLKTHESNVRYTVEEIKAHLEELNRISDEDWMNSLDDRKKKELEFHDKYRDMEEIENLDEDTYEHLYGNKKYYVATKYSWAYVNDRIAEFARDRVFLDYCCGNGDNTLKAARAGAKMAIGVDISRVSVENARRKAAEEGLTNAFFVQGDAENTKLLAESVDTVLCSGVLHHLDLTYAFYEMRRVLAPGGRVIVFDALDYNPVIKAYRNRTPQMRTEWEAAHILDLKDLELAKRFFEVEDVNYWHIFGILTPHMPWAAGFLRRLDDVLTSLPGIRLMAWCWSFEMVKRHQSV